MIPTPLEYIGSLEATIKAFQWAADSGAVFERNPTQSYRLVWKHISIWENYRGPWAATHLEAIKAAIPYYKKTILPILLTRVKQEETL